MTDKPTPTDAELKAMWQLHAADIGGIFCYARAVLQRWNQPSGTGKAAEHYRNAIASACEGWTMPDGLRKHLETALWSLPTQPAGAEEPFCWHWENTFNGGTGTVKKNPETLGINMTHPDHKWTALYTAQQPTQTQPVARKPLTDEQIQDLLLCGNPTDEEMRLIRIGWDAANGIKGGQHVS